MHTEDQYLDRTPDLVAKVRAMREAADREMDRFTRVADYDVRRVIGDGPKASPVSVETVPPSAVERTRRAKSKAAMPTQTSMEFAPAPAEHGEDGEDA
jgi:hypothetical protein